MYKTQKHKIYLKLCEVMQVTPKSYERYCKQTKEYGEWKSFWRNHYSIHDKDFNWWDLMYIRSRPNIDVKRKSFINQNMCLFWKNYFRRKVAI